ncbi:complex I 24 kDa subunit family protein [Parasedimentitalea maritima]|nr:NAD(P)H-dependent oxidoreductase subunit E [Zongyanglinia marina]
MSDARSLTDIKRDLATGVRQMRTRYPTSRSAIMPALELAQQKYGQLEGLTYQAVSELLDVPEIWVFEVASFYSLFDRAQTGLHHLRLCTNLSCMLRGSDALMQHLQDRLAIKSGETTSDGSFTLTAVECLGACEMAPALMVDARYHGDLTTDKLDGLLASLAGRPAKEAT